MSYNINDVYSKRTDELRLNVMRVRTFINLHVIVRASCV